VKWILAAVIGAVIAFSLSLAVRLGVFKEAKIEILQEPAIKLLYKEHVGPYHKLVPVIEEVETWAKEHGINCSKSFGEYLDNPDIVEEVRLRANGGCVVDDFPENMPSWLLTSTKIPQKYIKVVFQGSPSIGPFKVYAPVRRLANEQRLKLLNWNLEIYLIHNENNAPDAMTTTYLFPIETQ
jgi:effector-binding domain-containing protein